MKTISWEDFCSHHTANKVRAVVCIGVFDGVHRGHKEILNKVVSLSHEKHALPTAITFTLNPKDSSSQEITTLKERENILNELGLELLVTISPTPSFKSLEGEAFVSQVEERLDIVGFVCGEDAQIGNPAAAWRVGELRRHFQDRLTIVEDIKSDGVKISSTLIRSLIKSGNTKEAKRLRGLL